MAVIPQYNHLSIPLQLVIFRLHKVIIPDLTF
jgi:hypothetical protein